MGTSEIWKWNIYKKISNIKIDMYTIGYKYYLRYFIRYWFISLLIVNLLSVIEYRLKDLKLYQKR